jgi:hypothetical protein
MDSSCLAEIRTGAQRPVEDPLELCPELRTFATLSSKCKEEEAEDLVYFILDIYQFYGVQVALAELDIDQVREGPLAKYTPIESRIASSSVRAVLTSIAI